VSVAELRAEALSLRVGGRLVLDRYDFRAAAGELVGLRGPSGSGKSTLLQALAGLRVPDAGRVLVDGRPAVPWRETTLAVVAQTLQLPALLTVAETVAVPLQSAGLGRPEVATRAEAAGNEFGLGPLADQLVSTLSGGQRQRVALAQTVARRPDIVLADEPTAALDAQGRHAAMARLAALAHAGAIVVMASNDDETLDECDRVVDL
jgi:ABC-type multidrug transport system ATPase subunit